MQFRFNPDAILTQLDASQMHHRCILDANLDAVITESEMHLITSKLEQNMNQKPDQQIKNQIKT